MTSICLHCRHPLGPTAMEVLADPDARCPKCGERLTPTSGGGVAGWRCVAVGLVVGGAATPLLLGAFGGRPGQAVLAAIGIAVAGFGIPDLFWPFPWPCKEKKNAVEELIFLCRCLFAIGGALLGMQLGLQNDDLEWWIWPLGAIGGGVATAEVVKWVAR